ncbi:hypothetical protein [Haliscomenobacter hydrossis]|uniref:Uncharacterized protein n=1 Tax=Haliscomenobacter hydrossis (strain ATCC 27775 / DSM 1100 / LMG 10767 / O) TaxID=760192 RepID=F4L572_HALH1|nr:hypothetical protein [Haliscomenobacter hydrossis]AEE49752.1 hypothetical protein Halhy_1867 [Haliscomenobacter hydrossis DSM 1100]
MCKGIKIRITGLLCLAILLTLQVNSSYGQSGLQASLSTTIEKKSSSPQQVISQLSHQASTDYFSVICTGELDMRAFPIPVAIKAIQDASALLVQDARYDLGCNAMGFVGYFDPSRWMDANIQSAGGVDVTGAPGQLLVEGTNNYPVVVADRRAPYFTVKVPSSGYVTFNWNDIGGSLSNPTALAVYVNTRQIPAEKGQVSVFMQAGDELKLQVNPDAQAVLIHHFAFLSDLAYLITREWVNEQREVIASQYIAVEKPNLGDIRFPRNTVVDKNVQPEYTGYPILDTDGNAKTTEDQIVLAGTFNGFSVTYQDQIDVDNRRILRVWTINDTCGGNVLSHVQELAMETKPAKNTPVEDNKVKNNSIPHNVDPGGSYSSSFLVFN